VKRYEGLFILNTAGKEDGVKEIIDAVSKEITSAGGKIETVQKLDKRQFSRVSDKRHTSGFYVNIFFEAAPTAIQQLRRKFSLNEDVFRVLFTVASAPVAAPAN
jgi:small subunit ribosomal protein S6